MTLNVAKLCVRFSATWVVELTDVEDDVGALTLVTDAFPFPFPFLLEPLGLDLDLRRVELPLVFVALVSSVRGRLVFSWSWSSVCDDGLFSLRAFVRSSCIVARSVGFTWGVSWFSFVVNESTVC